MAAGVSKAFPGAEQRDDMFHAVYRMGLVRPLLEKAAWTALERLVEAEEVLAQVKRERLPVQSATQKLRHATKRFDEAAERHDRFEVLMKQATEEMSFIGTDSGKLRNGDEQAVKIIKIADQIVALGGKKIRKVGRYLKNRAPGLASYMDHLAVKLGALAETYGTEIVVLGCRLWRCIRDHNRASRWDKHQDRFELEDVKPVCTL